MSSQIAIKLLSDNFHADPRVRDFHAGAIFANSPNEIPRLSSDFERLIGFRARAERIFDLPVSQSSLKKKKKILERRVTLPLFDANMRAR